MTIFSKTMIFHTHIEKAAGTTTLRGLQRSLGWDHVHDLRLPTTTPPSEMTKKQKSKTWVLTGHFAYGAHIDQFARTKVFIASVRDPFERFRSYINYIGPNHSQRPLIEGKSFPEIVADFLKEERPQACNWMARVLTGLDEPTFEDAKRAVEQNYLYVAPHRRVNEGLEALLTLAGRALQDPDFHGNKARTGEAADIGALELEFRQANRVDSDLHKFVEDNFDRWIGDLDNRWRTTALSTPNMKVASSTNA